MAYAIYQLVDLAFGVARPRANSVRSAFYSLPAETLIVRILVSVNSIIR